MGGKHRNGSILQTKKAMMVLNRMWKLDRAAKRKYPKCVTYFKEARAGDEQISGEPCCLEKTSKKETRIKHLVEATFAQIEETKLT